jgi:hypothetical protein
MASLRWHPLRAPLRGFRGWARRLALRGRWRASCGPLPGSATTPIRGAADRLATRSGFTGRQGGSASGTSGFSGLVSWAFIWSARPLWRRSRFSEPVALDRRHGQDLEVHGSDFDHWPECHARLPGIPPASGRRVRYWQSRVREKRNPGNTP